MDWHSSGGAGWCVIVHLMVRAAVVLVVALVALDRWAITPVSGEQAVGPVDSRGVSPVAELAAPPTASPDWLAATVHAGKKTAQDCPRPPPLAIPIT